MPVICGSIIDNEKLPIFLESQGIPVKQTQFSKLSVTVAVPETIIGGELRNLTVSPILHLVWFLLGHNSTLPLPSSFTTTASFII